MSRVAAVLWDIDGTLLASEDTHRQAIVHVAATLGVALNEPDLAALTGLSIPATHARLQQLFGLSATAAEWETAVSDAYVNLIASVHWRSGALEMVERVKAAGIPQACVSNSSRAVVAANMARMDRPDALAFALCRDDVLKGKPHPEPYLTAARRLGVAPAKCLVVEDSPPGAAAGAAAGMQVLAWPFYPELRFLPDAILVYRLEDADWSAFLADN